MIDAKKKAFVVAALRRASYRWWGRYTALKNANIGRNQYVCAMCPPDTVHPKKNIQLDHVLPIVPISGWDNFDGFIDRLFCDTEGYQVLCKSCHTNKTLVENSERKETRKARNKKVKKTKEKA